MDQCKWCGSFLQPGIVACPSCGTTVAVSENSTPGQIFQEPGAPAPSQQRRSPLSRGATITYAALALLALFSGLTLILYSGVIHPAQLHQQATATAIAQVNLEASQTALANAQSSATAIAITNATATAQALATAQAIATATALQNIYTQATGGAPVINDSLVSDNYNRDIGNTNDGGGCFFINANQHDGYLFNVTLAGIYGIFIIKNNQAGAALTSGQSAAINTRPNAANLLSIVARGNNIFMYVNKQFVTSMTEHSLPLPH